jgi:D-alanyl-lipoteichoic acid acyltransferase DltB (MBOAT superfamily)
MSSAIVDFVIAKKIYYLADQFDLNSDEKIKQKILFQRKCLLISSVIFNIALLAFFKYWNWIIESTSLNLNINLGFLIHNFGLPIAISFYTFESLSYTFDVYRRKFTPTNKFIDYLTFIAFFPKLVAGPIMRAHELLPQLSKFRAKVSSKNLELAIFLICWGLCKKLVFADNLGHLVDDSYSSIYFAGAGLILGLAFSYQDYCDFSAYCDIARGTSKLFSIKLKRNFLTPFFSKNGFDFFRRWHISLSSWVRDYVYLTIKERNLGKFTKLIALYVSLVLFGIWHGAGIFFFYYGFYAATMVLLYRITKIDVILVKIFGKNFGGFLAILLCFFVIMLGMIIFWVKSYDDFTKVMSSLFAIFPLIFSPSQIPDQFFDLGKRALILILPIFITDLLGYFRSREFVDFYPILKTRTKVIIYVTLFYLTLFFASRGSYDFIYFKF